MLGTGGAEGATRQRHVLGNRRWKVMGSRDAVLVTVGPSFVWSVFDLSWKAAGVPRFLVITTTTDQLFHQPRLCGCSPLLRRPYALTPPRPKRSLQE